MKKRKTKVEMKKDERIRIATSLNVQRKSANLQEIEEDGKILSQAYGEGFQKIKSMHLEKQ